MPAIPIEQDIARVVFVNSKEWRKFQEIRQDLQEFPVLVT
jgi:hypothetical protein